MQPLIPGYRLAQELHRSDRSRVYRAVREADQRPVVIKTINKDFPDPRDLARLRHEHRILSALQLSGVPRAYALAPWENNVALVMEDGGVPLTDQLQPDRPLPIEACFQIALASARVLGQLHQRVIHQELNPRHMLWDPTAGEIRLIDFSRATETAPGCQRPEDAAPPVGSLAFMSPEQTGRMSREVDFRTDFYSLGVTLYRLLTGRLPFEAPDPVGWVHCHMTQPPLPPEQLNPHLPGVLGALVLKLMAKNPEDRYQSAQALWRDLAECRRQWRETGTVISFPLAHEQIQAQLQLPRRLYGREPERLALLEAFDEAAAGQTRLVILSGPAGIGKSRLVGEARRAFAERGGAFCEGKFDQFQRQIPYSAVTQALGARVRQLMAEPEERLAEWRAGLAEALGPNGRIAVDLVPALAGVIGDRPPVAGLPPTEEQNRFLQTIRSLITAFSRPERPLVLFLDDLQWSAGPAPMLMRSLLDSGAGRPLLLVAAYRDDEVDEGHPLAAAVAELVGRPDVRHLTLGPLDAETLNAVVADTFQAPPERTRPLGEILHAKSGGNPFFAGELLRTLHQDALVAFDPDAGSWRWDMEAIHRAKLSDDVVAYVIERIQRLPPATRVALQQAACIGDTFDARLLAKLAGAPVAAAAAALGPAITAGLVAPLEPGQWQLRDLEDPGPGELRCQFLHDRVRQAAYALLPDDERRRLHLALGRLMLFETPAEAIEARATAIAQQLNEGRTLLDGEADRLELAALNLTAGRRAQASAAYGTALQFLGVARELLPATALETQRTLALEVLGCQASCAALSGAHELADSSYAELLAHTRDPLDRAEIHARRAAEYTFNNRMDTAIAEGLTALALLGIRLSARPGPAAVAAELLRCKAALGRRSAEDLDRAPALTDRAVRVAMRILGGFLAPAYLTGNDTLFAITVLKQATLSLRHGLSEESVSAYSGYAVLLAGLGDLKGAHAFGRLALRLSEKFATADSRCRLLVLYGLFSHSWSQPWRTLEPWFKQAVEAGLHSGDFLFMAYACGYVHLWDPQIDLKTAIEEGRYYLALCKQTTYGNALDAMMCAQQLWLNLRGETDGPLLLSGAGFDEAACLARMTEAHYMSGVAIYHLCKLQVACFQQARALAWQELLASSRVIGALAGAPYMVDYCVYGFQAAAGIASEGGPEAGAARRFLQRFRRQMRGWARHCPENFQHHAELMEAELARLGGRHDRAPQLYEQAIQSARHHGFVRDEARANELAAAFYRARGLEKVAATYMRDARDGYARWGAVAKVRALDAARPASAGPGSEPGLVDLGQVPQLVQSGQLDLSTVWKATQAISGEATLEALLERLLAIVKESAGAQRGLLVLDEGPEGAPCYMIQAESAESGRTRLLQAEPLEAHPGLPVSLIRYVLRSRTSVVLSHAADEGEFTRDPYIERHQPRSALALPIIAQGQLLGALYLENQLLRDVFTPERLSVLTILAGQAAISLRNMRAAERAAYIEAERSIKDTYARQLEARVEERTAELSEAYQQLMALDRLKTNFLSVVSHELRTPLTTIQGYAEFLEDGVGGPITSEQEEFVKRIQQGAAQLRRLVDDLLDFARAEGGTLKLVLARVDMGRLLTETLDSLQPILKEHDLSLETSLPDEAVWVQADAGRLVQVVLNLTGNAVKFTPRGGRLAVSLGLAPDELRIEVTDTGIGVPEEHLPRLFQRFYQVDSSSTRERGGVGLGLSIAHSIVEAHGGRIGVTSAPGQGSTFWFTLPLTGPVEAPVATDASEV